MDQVPVLANVANDLNCTTCFLIKNQFHFHIPVFNKRRL